ncbi:MAG: hypothetical protein AB7O74_06575 [Candidatus Nanopelagicales bacterium]
MGARAGGDGRLDLDELGSVIEGASPAGGETLHDAFVAPSFAERLEDAGVLPWLRRHRGLSASLTVAACAGVIALAVHQATEPPPFDPRVTASVAPLPPERGDDVGAPPSNGRLVARLAVTGVPPGDSVEVLEISGPGLGPSAASVLATGDTAADGPGSVPWTVSTAIDCTSPRSLTANPLEYAVVLQRTDRWGRTTQAAQLLPESAKDWAARVQATCWAGAVRAGVALDSLDVRSDPVRGTVTLGLGLSNSTPLRLLAGSAPAEQDDRGIKVGQSFRINLGAGSTGETEVLLTVTSCDRAAAPVLGAAQDRVVVGSPRGAGLVLDAASPDRQLWTTVPLAFTTEQAARVGSAVRAVCAGAPRAEVATLGAPVVQALGGPTDERQLRVRLDVRPASGRLVSIDVEGDAGLPAVFSARSLPDADGTVEALWRFTCANTPGPPTVALTLADGDRTWPQLARLDDEAVERAVLRSCPTQTAEALTAAGWPARVLVRG